MNATDRIMCVRQLRFNRGRLEQLLMLDRTGQSVEEWQEVPGKTGRGPDRDWSAVDWSKRNKVIAKEMGVSDSAVSNARRRLGKPIKFDYQNGPTTIHSRKRFVTEEMIAGVEWEFSSDTQVSKKLGVSRERVRQIREGRKLPQCIIRAMTDKVRRAYDWFINHRDEIQGRNAFLVARECPEKISVTRLHRILKSTGIQLDWTVPDKHENAKYKVQAALYNWSLPNVWLHRVWGETAIDMANIRSRLRLGKPKWDARFVVKEYLHDPEFVQSLDAEISKAKSHGIDNRESVQAALVELRIRKEVK